ncbi:MAG: hypothetical protein H0V09_04405 [Gemmatimonadetes bacterium]|nr:hypothetical protein [Gemmatimonadota bacterium]
MTRSTRTWLTAIAVLGLATLAGCQQGRDAGAGDEMAGDTAAMPGETDAEDDADAAGAGGGTSGGQVAVTNSMPHAMVVKADGGQGETELGTVAPNESRTFDVASSGGPVTLTASDSAATHSVSGTVSPTPGAPAEWTIQ